MSELFNTYTFSHTFKVDGHWTTQHSKL